MKLLFITQKVDQRDDLLGVYHEWIARLAGSFEKISVICLYQGITDLPKNVHVYSLGKEEYANAPLKRLHYLARFYKYIFQLRGEYDTVFVHMNTIYVLLGALLWRAWGKRVVLWFAHYKPYWQLSVAEKLVNSIVTSVPQACAITSHKVHAIGQGIDLEQFGAPHAEATSEARILFLGRIAPIKKLELLFESLGLLKKQSESFSFSVVGAPGDMDAEYAQKIYALPEKLGLEDKIFFKGKVSNSETPELYRTHDIFVNLTPTGSFDKTTLEAMAAGSLVLVSNRAFLSIFPKDLRGQLMFKEGDAEDLAEKLRLLIALPSSTKKEIGERLRRIVRDNHSISTLAARLLPYLNPRI